MRPQIKTVGYIALDGKNPLSSKVYKNKKTMQTARALMLAKKAAKRGKQIAGAFIKAARLEAAVMIAKKAVKLAKLAHAGTVDLFLCWVDLLKAYRAVNSFRFSLPKNICSLLF